MTVPLRPQTPDVSGGLIERSDLENGDVGVTSGESSHVARIVRCDDAAAESHRSRDDERINGHLTPGSSVREEMASDPSHPGSRRDNLRETPSQHRIDRLVDTPPAVQLDEYRRRDPNRRIPSMRATHRRSDPLMSLEALVWTCERGHGLAVKN